MYMITFGINQTDPHQRWKSFDGPELCSSPHFVFDECMISPDRDVATWLGCPSIDVAECLAQLSAH